MLNVLIADDDAVIRDTVSKYCRREGFNVSQAENGLEAVSLCEKTTFDIIMLDIMMPRLDGYSACEEIRKYQQTPIIMLSALGDEYDKLRGFELGISDYIVKPFSYKELMMRVKALNRLMARNSDCVNIGDLKIDLTGQTVQIGQEGVQLAPREAALLFFMVKNRGIALSRDIILNHVWGYDYDGSERTLDSHVKMLRKSLGDYGKYITTLKGVGYRFEKE